MIKVKNRKVYVGNVAHTEMEQIVDEYDGKTSLCKCEDDKKYKECNKRTNKQISVLNNSRQFVPLTSYLNCKPFTIRSIRSTRVFTSCTSANSFACIYNVLSFGNYIWFGLVDGIPLYEWNCCALIVPSLLIIHRVS